MYYLVGYVVLLTFTIGLLAWVYLLKTTLSKKVKQIISAVILSAILIIGIVFTSFLPNKWTNILYFLGLILGFVVVVALIYFLVTAIYNAIHKGEEDASNKQASFKEQVKNLKQKAMQRKQEKQQAEAQKGKKSSKNKVAVKKEKKADKGSNLKIKESNQQKKQNKKTPQKGNKIVKNNPTKQNNKGNSSKKKNKPRRLEDYEPSDESVASKLKKPEKANFNRHHKS